MCSIYETIFVPKGKEEKLIKSLLTVRYCIQAESCLWHSKQAMLTNNKAGKLTLLNIHNMLV